jgi:hypothetical protein
MKCESRLPKSISCPMDDIVNLVTSLNVLLQSFRAAFMARPSANAATLFECTSEYKSAL